MANEREFIAAKDLPVVESEDVNMLVVNPATGEMGQKPANSEPDLLIWLNKKNPNSSKHPFNSNESSQYNISDISIESGSVAAVIEKLQRGMPVRVLMEEINFYNETAWTNGQTEAIQVHVAHDNGQIQYPNTPVTGLACVFYIDNCPTMTMWGYGNAPLIVKIGFDAQTESAVAYVVAQMRTS